jgi:hypothetical protein
MINDRRYYFLSLCIFFGSCSRDGDVDEKQKNDQKTSKTDSLQLIRELVNNSYQKIDSLKMVMRNKSESVIWACYEGTQNTAMINLRKDGSFDILWTSAFGGFEFYEGSYTHEGDTLFLTYYTQRPQRVGSVLLIKSNQITSINSVNNQSFKSISFVIGDCQGKN